MAKSPKKLANYDADYARAKRRRRVAKPLAILLAVIVVVAVVALVGRGLNKPHKSSTVPTTYPTKLLTVGQATTITVITDHSTCGSVAAVGELLADLKSSVSGVPTYASGEQTFYENYEQAFALNDSAADEAIESFHNSHFKTLAATVAALNALAQAQHEFAVSVYSLTNPTSSQLRAAIAKGEAQVDPLIAKFGDAWAKESLKYNC